MIGDVLLIEQKHERVAREIAAKLHRRQEERLVVAIGGESGSGKSEIAETLRAVLRTENRRVKILHLDNYYIVAPAARTEHRRRHGMSAVGLHEIDWELLEENIQAFRSGKPSTIPFLDLYTNQEDKLVTDFKPIDLLILEGLYACNASADIRVHIDLTYHETKKAQLKRKKEKVDAFRFEVLEKEHRVVTTIRGKTDYFVTPGFTLIDNTDKHTPLESEEGGRLLICSYELPFTARKRKGKIRLEARAGGVGNVIGAVYRAYDSVWFGDCPLPERYTKQDHQAVARELKASHAMQPLGIDSSLKQAAGTFCSGALWPLFHYRPESCVFRDAEWEAYVRFNKAYYNRIRRHIRPHDTIWIHDYQLMLLPELIRRSHPEASIGFFLHTPFPSFELFRMLPWRRELLQGVIAADLIGFHIYEYTRHFQSSIFRILGHESNMGSFISGNHLTHTDAYTVGVDTAGFTRLRAEPEVRTRIERLQRQAGGCPVVVSIDRLVPARGILEKLAMIERFLETYSRFRKQVVFMLCFFDGANDPLGRRYRRDVEARIAAINRAWGTTTWQPLIVRYGQAPLSELVALYNIADVLLVASLRDGMNLIGKEYIAARESERGVIILSEFTGGARELTEAISINPFHTATCADAIAQALTMPGRKQAASFKRLKQRLERNTALRCAVEFFEDIKKVKARQERISSRAFTARDTARLLTDYHTADRRLFVLDYNGTLVPAPRDGRSKPPPVDVRETLAVLAGNKRNRVVIITDNPRDMMQPWFRDSPVDLITCSDAAYRAGGKWTSLQELSMDWKAEALPIFERYVVRTPGSYMDEKKYAMIWHFEKAVKELADVRSRELTDDLKSFAGMQNLQINEGDGFIEMKNAETHKASLMKAYLGDGDWRFVFAAGDDLSNEVMFECIPESAYTLRIGGALTSARYNLTDQVSLITLLKEIANTA